MPWLARRHAEAESDHARETIEGYMREVPCPVCGGARLKPESLAVTVAGRNIFELCDLSLGDATAADEQPGAVRAGPPDRRPGAAGDPGPDAVPARRRPRLPEPQPLGRHPGRRGGAAHPAGVADRQRPGRGALRARRAVDRAAPAGQPQADRDPAAPPRPGQHGDRGRARRGHHPGGRPRRRHRPGCRRARRQHRGVRLGRRPAQVQGVASPAST